MAQQGQKDNVAMVLGGTRYIFAWGTRAIREIQELLSTPNHLVTPAEIFAEVKRGRIRYVCAFIWAGLLKHHPGMSETAVDDLLDTASEAEIDALLKEFGMSLTPDAKDLAELRKGVKKNPQKAREKTAAGTGAK